MMIGLTILTVLMLIAVGEVWKASRQVKNED
jgi:competence protein ComGC